jgi:hypothetical protein
MMSLPFPPNCILLKSFWLVMSAAGGVLIGALSSRLLPSLWPALSVAGTVALAVPGLLRPQIASLLYRAWHRLWRLFARQARGSLLLICYYLVFVAVGRTGSPLRLSRPSAATSLWVPWDTYEPSVRGGSRGVTVEGVPHRSWVPSLLVWAISTHNWWVCCLLPFLLLYAALASEQEQNTFPAGIYTLF